MKGGMLAVSAASKVANKVKEDRQKSKAKLEDETRRVVASFWTSLEKGEDDVLNRAEYRQVVETLEPDSMPLDEETMDEVEFMQHMIEPTHSLLPWSPNKT